jgi:hypothetical protein
LHKKSDPKVLFKEMDRDGSHSVDIREFCGYFESIKSQQKGPESELDRKINEKSLAQLFKALDADGSKSLDLTEFCMYIGYTEKMNSKKLDNIDEDTLASIDQMIDRLFRKVDANHNGFVDIEELYNLLKPLRPGKISLAECK